jgi:hypothetical protein
MTPPVVNDTIEFELLISAARPVPDLGRLRRLLADGAVDFAVLEELANEHSVRPLLSIALAAIQWKGVPGPARESLEAFSREHLVHGLAMGEVLGRLTRLFGENGVRFASFKGAVLAVDLYGGLARREFTDIDVIVAPEARGKAEDLAATLGHASRQGDRVFRETFLAFQRQYLLVGAGTAIDLHWGFTSRPLPFPLRAGEIWSRLVTVHVGNVEVPSLAPDDTALLLAGHGMKETWRSLSWICDFAMMIDRHPRLDWAALYERARRQGCGDSVLVGAVLVERLCGVPVPVALKVFIEQRPRVGHLVSRIAARLRDRRALMQGQRDLDDLDLCDDAWGRFKALLGFAFTPTPGDHRALPLPRPLWPLYYVTRPFRLASRILFRR